MMVAVGLLFAGMLFVPLEKAFRRRPQSLFRPDWREDLFYFFVSSLFIQGLTYLSLAPALELLPPFSLRLTPELNRL